MKSKQALSHLVTQRVANAAQASTLFDECGEVVVFGSMSAGLERPDSDIDVLCCGKQYSRFKSDELDLTVVPIDEMRTRQWLGSELASHILEYGTWIKGACGWALNVRMTREAGEKKYRRVKTFIKVLPGLWPQLDETFRVKYATKLRREAQRLILIEGSTPIPPTRILDDTWRHHPRSLGEVYDRLKRIVSPADRDFRADLLRRIEGSPDEIPQLTPILPAPGPRATWGAHSDSQ